MHIYKKNTTMKKALFLLLILAACSKKSDPIPEPKKTCGAVTMRGYDNTVDKYFLVTDITSGKIFVTFTQYGEYTLGAPICFDQNNNIVR